MTNPRLDALRAIATDVAAANAADVDQSARFPAETVHALKAQQFLAAAVPETLGGWGCSLRDLAMMCATLAQGCGSSGMVLAMHHIQVACLARHGAHSRFFQEYLRDVAERQLLIASMTSEVGTFGDTRSSVCAVERADGRFVLQKNATTGSYCEHADSILVTARRALDAAPSDQVLVLVRRQDCDLATTTTWDTLGMRGTCSPGFRLDSRGCEAQIVPGAFADSSAQTMVPYSHILWSSVWTGVAADALARAAAFVRAEARKQPGTVPPAAIRLARATADLQALRAHWTALADDVDRVGGDAEGLAQLLAIGWGLRMNHLKVHASDSVVGIVHEALQIVGLAGYKNDSPFSVGRQYRDALSAPLMISNDRVAARSAAMLLVFKDE